jgi:hypothetical protein
MAEDGKTAASMGVSGCGSRWSTGRRRRSDAGKARIAAEVRGAAPEIRLAARREKAAPIVAALKPWVEAQLSRLPRRSQLATDIRLTRSPAGRG